MKECEWFLSAFRAKAPDTVRQWMADFLEFRDPEGRARLQNSIRILRGEKLTHTDLGDTLRVQGETRRTQNE